MKKILLISAMIAGVFAIGATLDVWLLTEVTQPDSTADVLPIVKTGGSAGAGRKITMRHLAEWVVAITHPRSRFVDESNGTGGVYSTLAAAATAAQAGDKIELLSNVTASGGATVASVNVTLETHGHKIIAATQDDTRKLTITGDGFTGRNIDINGTWDLAHSGTTTGSGIFISAKNVTLENVNVHDIQDAGIYANVADFSGVALRHVTVNNYKGGGIALTASGSGNNDVNGVDLDFITITHAIGGAQALAVNNNGSQGWINGFHLSHFYIDDAGAHEAAYIHRVRDFSILGGQTSNAEYNISLDVCEHGTVSNVESRGGRMTDQYCGMELAWCRWMTISNCVFDGNSRSTPVTITIASPGVITWTAHGLANGRKVTFETTGALPTGITPRATYFVINSATNTFQVSATSGGSAINTSGSQSGQQRAATVSDGSTGPGGTTAGIVASTFSAEYDVAGPYTISNVIAVNWNTGVYMTSVYGINITGSWLQGSYSGVSVGGCGNVQIIGNYLEANGPDVYDSPISIDSGASSNDTAYNSVGLNKNFTIIGNHFKGSPASTTSGAEIAILSQDSTDTINGVTIKDNVRLDAIAFTTVVKQETGTGGVISNVVITGNVPDSGWPNVAANVSLKAVTFANAKASPAEGTIQPFTDSSTATHGATITGGGSNHVLGYYNSAGNWVVAYP